MKRPCTLWLRPSFPMEEAPPGEKKEDGQSDRDGKAEDAQLSHPPAVRRSRASTKTTGVLFATTTAGITTSIGIRSAG